MAISTNNEVVKIKSKNLIKNLSLRKRKHKRIDAFKYCGIIKLNEDPLIIQKRLRDEWN